MFFQLTVCSKLRPDLGLTFTYRTRLTREQGAAVSRLKDMKAFTALFYPAILKIGTEVVYTALKSRLTGTNAYHYF